MKILLLLLLTLSLFGCSNEITINEPLVFDAYVKDHKEFIIVDQFTKTSDFDVAQYIEVITNRDDYEIKWVGQGFSNNEETYEEILSYKTAIEDSYLRHVDINKELFEKDRQTTLDCDGFRPITIYFNIKDGENVVTRQLNTLVLVVPEYKKELLYSLEGESIETVYREMTSKYLKEHPGYKPRYIGNKESNGKNSTHYIYDTYGYFSNIRENNAYVDGRNSIWWDGHHYAD